MINKKEELRTAVNGTMSAALPPGEARKLLAGVDVKKRELLVKSFDQTLQKMNETEVKATNEGPEQKQRIQRSPGA